MLDFLDAEEVSICFVSNFDSKEYYEIIDDARPLSGFFPLHADFFRVIRALIPSQSTFEI